jgi:uncharacterized protein
MPHPDTPKPGEIAWFDLTVPDAEQVSEFYSAVVGWSKTPVSMGDYNDYCVLPKGSERPEGGVCHARGGNADLPAAWLAYVVVEDLDASLGKCKELGGTVLVGPKAQGPTARYAVIRDPAGAVLALYQTG